MMFRGTPHIGRDFPHVFFDSSTISSGVFLPNSGHEMIFRENPHLVAILNHYESGLFAIPFRFEVASDEQVRTEL